MGGRVSRDPKLVLRNIWTAPYWLLACRQGQLLPGNEWEIVLLLTIKTLPMTQRPDISQVWYGTRRAEVQIKKGTREV